MKSCKVIRGGESFLGKQGLNYFAGVSAEIGKRRSHLHAPAGDAARRLRQAPLSRVPRNRDLHAGGCTEFLHGPNLEFKDRVEAGDYVYIPAGVPHQPYNPTDKPARAIIARTDPNEQESVVLLGS